MSTLPFEQSTSGRLVPPEVSEKISDVMKRTRGTRILSGSLVASAAALAVVLIAIGLDWALVPFEPQQRTQLTVSALVLMGLFAAICFVVTAMRRVSTLEAARQIDCQVPALEERWMSVTEFSSTNDKPERRGSESFIRKVAEEAAQLEHFVHPESIHMGNDLFFASVVLVIVTGLWVVAVSYDPVLVTVLVRRFISPQSQISLTQIQSESGDLVVPHGSRLKLEASATGRVLPQAELVIRKSGNADETFKLDALKEDPTRFVHPIKDLQIPFSYRFRSGDGQTAWHKVTIAERPQLKLVDFKIVPPAYSKLPEIHQHGLPKSVSALQGSRLFLAFESSILLKSLVLQGEDKVDRTLVADDANVYRWEMELKDTFVFRPVLQSTYGLTNSHPPRCEIIVYRDQAPVVEIADPTNEVVVRPDDALTISFNAKDDLGISKAELVIFEAAADGAEEMKVIPIPLGDQTGEKSVHAQAELDLKNFALKHGEQLTYAIRVYDTKNETTTKEPRSTPPDAPVKAETPLNPENNDQNNNQINHRNQVGPESKESQSVASNPAGETVTDPKPESVTTPVDSNKETRQTDSEKTQANADSQQDQPPKKQLEGGNTWKPKNPGKAPPTDSPDEITGKRRPDFFMAKHELDTPPGQCSSCSRHHIKIDEWAGSFASQVLDKLQLQIDPMLSDLKKTLTKAKDALHPIEAQTKPTIQWIASDSLAVRTGDEFLVAAEGQVKALADKTDGTPYAFIGLQLQDITHLHISPAREHLRDVTLFDMPARAEDLTASVVHIDRAIELLEKLTRQYETVKLNQKLADTMINIKKMHQLFLEGTFAMLNSEKPLLNPKERAFMELELTEEFIAKLQKLLQKKLEIQGELAKLLSQDPRLLQRYMARIRLEATTLRDQLTLLNQRQQTLLAEVQDGLPEINPPEGKLELKNRIPRRAESAAQIAEETAKMLDNFVLWTPLNRDVDEGDLAKFKAKGVKLVSIASQLAQESKKQKDSKASELGDALYDGLVEWEKTLPDLLAENRDPKMQLHVANRVEEAQRLITDVSGWAMKESAMEAGDHHLAAEIDQHRLTVDTMILTRKLNSIKAQCQGISIDLATKANEFLKTMEEDLVPELEESQLKLDENDLLDAIKHQTVAVEHFTKAEKQLDEVMDGIIKHLDSQPFDEKPEFPDGLEPESLEELLAMLEDEARAAETLGIPGARPSNLLIEKDWSLPGSRPGSESGGSSGSSPGRRSMKPSAQREQSQMASQQADKIRKRMEDSLNKLKGNGNDQKQGVADKAERKWDTLGSKLEDHLRQARGNLPPEQYRKAIEQYFESLAGKSQSGPKGD